MQPARKARRIKCKALQHIQRDRHSVDLDPSGRDLAVDPARGVDIDTDG